MIADEDLLEQNAPLVEAMSMMTQPAVAVDQESIVLAGFRDCTEEAIRYLMEVEHLPEDDPLVIGLKQHLLARQQQLDVERILQGHSAATTASDSSSNSSDNADSVIMTCGEGGSHHNQITDSQASSVSPQMLPNSSSPGAQTDSASSRSDTPMSDIASEGNRSDYSEHHVPDSVMISSPNPVNPVVAGSQQESQQPQQQQAANAASILNLALLAQSNPAIASLTEEILSLLEGEVPVDIHESEEEADSAFLDESIEWYVFYMHW